MLQGISIIIPTYNSASRLEPTIQHIAAQELPTTIAWELIVVNNNSTDNTADVAKSLFEKYQIIENQNRFEPRQGLSFARDCGIKNAKYTYSIFCDDDNWLAKDYARQVFEQMETNHSMAALGGYGEPVCEIPPPSWFQDLSSYYAVGAQALSAGKIDNGYLYGAGLSIRNEVYHK
ncbi:MAG: glycosyltransferase family 2 protein [Saprospiraceae bacterium]|nr:glycosyltransferase family 2 protein [Saprospiraceae bacterium]